MENIETSRIMKLTPQCIGMNAFHSSLLAIANKTWKLKKVFFNILLMEVESFLKTKIKSHYGIEKIRMAKYMAR